MTRISVRCLGALPTFPAWLHSLPTSPTCYPAQRLDFCCSRRISQEATPASGVPRSVAWIPWCHCCLPHANRSDTVTELAYHTERLLAGQLHRPLSPCPWPEHRVGAKSQHGKPHALYSLIEPPAAHITRIYVPCAWGFTPQFWCWSETVSKFSEKCWYHNLVWSTEDTLGSLLCHVLNQCVYLKFAPFVTVGTPHFPAALAVTYACGNKLSEL